MKRGHQFEVTSKYTPSVARCSKCGLRIYVIFAGWKPTVGRMGTAVYALDENGQKRLPSEIPCSEERAGEE